MTDYKAIAAAVQRMGAKNVKGDTVLAHITTGEKKKLKKEGGSGRIDPVTGLPHFSQEDDGSDSNDNDGSDDSNDSKDQEGGVSSGSDTSKEQGGSVSSGPTGSDSPGETKDSAPNDSMKDHTGRDSDGGNNASTNTPQITSKLPGYDSPGFINNTGGALDSLENTQVAKGWFQRTADWAKVPFLGSKALSKGLIGAASAGPAVYRATREALNPGTTSKTYKGSAEAPSPSPATDEEGGNNNDSKTLTANLGAGTSKAAAVAAPTAADAIMDTFTTAARKKMGFRSTVMTSGLNTAMTTNKSLTGA